MGKKIIGVELHDGFFIPGLNPDAGGGAFGKSLPAAGKTLHDLEMELLDNGSVEVTWGKAALRTTITIGAANIKYCRHAVHNPSKTEKIVIKTSTKPQETSKSE